MVADRLVYLYSEQVPEVERILLQWYCILGKRVVF